MNDMPGDRNVPLMRWLVGFVLVPLVAALIGAGATVFAGRAEVLPDRLAPVAETETVTAVVMVTPEAVTETVTVVETITRTETEAETETVTVTLPQSPTPTSQDVSANQDRFAITTSIVRPVGAGRSVGPDKYQLTDGQADIGFGWELRVDGVPVVDRSCQIRVRISGPIDVGDILSDFCTGSPAGSFSGGQNGFTAKSPGEYTITVNDELREVVSSLTVTVVS